GGGRRGLVLTGGLSSTGNGGQGMGLPRWGAKFWEQGRKIWMRRASRRPRLREVAMKTLHKRCAGLDVHKVEVVACLRLISKRKVELKVRRFPTTTQGLLALAEWLESAGCTQRKQLTREIVQHVQRIQAVLEEANIKLCSVITDIMGASGRRMLKAMIAGETDAEKLAALGHERLGCTRAELVQVLTGCVREHH